MRTLVFYPALVLSTLFFSVVAVVGGLARAPREWFDWVHRNWSRSLLLVAGVRVEVEGLEHARRDRAQVLMANHQSIFDVWALMAALPVSLRFVAKGELARVPLFASACRAAGHVFIDRGRAFQATAAIRVAGERMRREGLTLVMFPEGTRSPDGSLGPFRRGTFALAIDLGAPLIPAAVVGGGAVSPPGRRSVHPGTIHVRLGEPLSMEGLELADRKDLLDRTRAAICDLLATGESERGGLPAARSRGLFAPVGPCMFPRGGGA